jgi:hypothetical protein
MSRMRWQAPLDTAFGLLGVIGPTARLSRVERGAVVSREKILGHLGLPVDVPQPAPARSLAFLPGVETPSDWITE